MCGYESGNHLTFFRKNAIKTKPERWQAEKHNESSRERVPMKPQGRYKLYNAKTQISHKEKGYGMDIP